MRYYPVEKRKDFLKNYEIKGNKIVAKMANGDKKVYNYTERNEEALLKKMENQVVLEEARVHMPIELIPTIALTAVLLLITLPVVILTSPTVVSGILAYVGFIALFGGMTYFGFKAGEDDHGLEIAKLSYFMENKDEINSKVKDKEGLKNVLKPRRFKKLEEKGVLDQPKLNVNNIDKLSIVDLRKIREGIVDIAKSKQTKCNDDFFDEVDSAYESFQFKKTNNNRSYPV